MPSEGGGSGAGPMPQCFLWGEDPFKGWPVSLLNWGDGEQESDWRSRTDLYLEKMNIRVGWG